MKAIVALLLYFKLHQNWSNLSAQSSSTVLLLHYCAQPELIADRFIAFSAEDLAGEFQSVEDEYFSVLSENLAESDSVVSNEETTAQQSDNHGHSDNTCLITKILILI